MGLSSKEVSIDDGLDWAMNLLKSNKRPRQQQQQQQQQRPPQLSCPRCNSTNTKFCYYNNYNREQPRHFCKSCKRHWTKGGTLRNVPIGGRRNNKRLKTTNTNKNNSNNNNNNNNTGVIGDINFVPQRQSMPLAFEDQKNISEILYQALYQSPSLQTNYINSTFSGSSLCLPSLPNLPFTSSSFSNENPSLLSSSFIDRFESSNVCDYSGDSETAELITTTDAIATNPLWKLSNASSLMESDCNWNWDDLNTLISNDLKQPWNDFQTKVQGI